MNILSSTLNSELMIDGRVLSYINNDSKLCKEYYNLLKSVNLDNALKKSQRERLPLIKDTCKYMKKYPFSFRSDFFREKSTEINKILQENIRELSSSLANEKSEKVILVKVLSFFNKKLIKKYYYNYEQKIMLKWYSKVMEEMLLPALKKVRSNKIEFDSEMDDAIVDTIINEGK